MSNSKPVLTIGIITKTQIYAFTMACVMEIMNNADLCKLVIPKQSMCIGQSDLPKARSSTLTRWYTTAKPGDVFMFLDADHVFMPSDIILSLRHLESHDIVCGAYPRKGGEMTLEPKDYPKFCEKKQGELFYGATGFMMMNYNIVDKIAKTLDLVFVNKTEASYPFFFERVVKEELTGEKPLWLGEDYSFCWLARQQGGSIYGYISPTIGHILTIEQFVQTPKINYWPEKSIAIYCGHTAEAWSANSLVGGSELAIINLTTYWVKHGYDVTVFCTCDHPGEYNGVKYRSVFDFKFTDVFDILIVWRAMRVLDAASIKARKCIVDLHDIVNINITEKIINNTDVFCVKSKYHKSMLTAEAASKAIVIPNGGKVNPEPEIKKDENYLIYTSSYDRGLAYMLKWGWPKIKKACPNAYIKIYYGWDVFDATHPDTKDIRIYKDTILELMNQDGVEECGRISNEKLLKEKSKAGIHYYVGDFQEIDCISVRESASMGAIPVVANDSLVFREKSYCVKIRGCGNQKSTQERAAKKIINLLINKEFRQKTRKEMIVPEEETWDGVAQKWLDHVLN